MSDEQLYSGREQSLVKHEILRRYLQRFARIIGSRWESITYIDCFSGPWKARSAELADTSFAIAIKELQSARETLQKRSKHLQLRCFFLEKSPSAYRQLQAFVGGIHDVEIGIRNATLEDSIDQIVEFVKRAPSSFPFVFVDPTGWTGFDLEVIQPLLKLAPGEVLINFMIEHIRRFIDSPDVKIAPSFDRLFGSPGVRETLNGLKGSDRDDAMAAWYVESVKKVGDFRFASRAVVLHPEKNRSHFDLLYFTRNAKGIEAFKDAEKAAMEKMESARAKAQQSRRLQRKGQPELFSADELHDSSYFEGIRNRYLKRATASVLRELTDKQRVSYDAMWEVALSFPLVWESDLKSWIANWESSGQLTIDGNAPGRRVPRREEGNMLVWKDREIRRQDCQ